MPARRRRPDARVREARRSRRRVGEEHRLVHRDAPAGLPARPEAEGDRLVRVPLARDRIGALARRRAPPGEARGGQVEAAPEEVHGALLAHEPVLERPQRRVDAAEHLPEAVRRLGVVGADRVVPVEGDGIGALDRRRPDAHLDPERVEPREVGVVERVHRHPAERQRLGAPLVAAEHDRVLDEVELHVDGALALQERRRRREPARRDAERGVPPVVLGRRQRERGLPDDLRPHVERAVRRPPGVERQLRPAAHRLPVVRGHRGAPPRAAVSAGGSRTDQRPRRALRAAPPGPAPRASGRAATGSRARAPPRGATPRRSRPSRRRGRPPPGAPARR